MKKEKEGRQEKEKGREEGRERGRIHAHRPFLPSGLTDLRQECMASVWCLWGAGCGRQVPEEFQA